MFWMQTHASICSVRLFLNTLKRCLPRVAATNEYQSTEKSSDYAVINQSRPTQNVKFNDYNIVKLPSSGVSSRPVPKSVPKLIDVQTGLNHFMSECDERTLLLTVESKYKLFDCNNVATFIQRLHEFHIKRDTDDQHHQRFYDFVDYLILKHGQQFDFDHVLKMFFQLASLNGTAKLESRSGSYALKGLIQLLKHHVNKYHLQETGRILITLEKELGCNVREDERIRPLFDAFLLLATFRKSELDRLDAHALAELAYAFAVELDHVYFTNILNEYAHDELYHDKYSTLLIFRALDRRGYRHNRTLDICLRFVHENKEKFTDEEMNEIKHCLAKLEFELPDE